MKTAWLSVARPAPPSAFANRPIGHEAACSSLEAATTNLKPSVLGWPSPAFWMILSRICTCCSVRAFWADHGAGVRRFSGNSAAIGGPSGAVVICRLGLASARGFGGGTLAGLGAKAFCARSAAGLLVRSSSGFLVVLPPRRLWTTSTISIPLGSHLVYLWVLLAGRVAFGRSHCHSWF